MMGLEDCLFPTMNLCCGSMPLDLASRVRKNFLIQTQKGVSGSELSNQMHWWVDCKLMVYLLQAAIYFWFSTVFFVQKQD